MPGFSYIQPAAVPAQAGIRGVDPFEAFDAATCLGGQEGFVERGFFVCIGIVLDERDCFCSRKMAVAWIFQRVGVTDRGVAIRDFDKTPALEQLRTS